MKWGLREHKPSGSYSPAVTFGKTDATRVYGDSTSVSMAYWYILKPFLRSWLNGKKFRITWATTSSYASMQFDVKIYDGFYDYKSDTDFPDGGAIPTKGNGLLQTIESLLGTQAEHTTTQTVNVSGGSQEYSTIFISGYDAWSAQSGQDRVHYIAILDASDNILDAEEFEGSVVMERTGTTKDYGYIGIDAIVIAGFRVEGRDFKETKFS
jgi:hypothetical protein